MKTKNITTLILIFITIASIVYAHVVTNENNAMRAKIEKYDSQVKVYYLQKDIKGEKY